MKLSDEYFDALNETLLKCSAIGAYCVGVVTCIIWERTGQSPTKAMLEAAAMCLTILDAKELAERFVGEMKPITTRAGGPAG